MNRDQAEAIIRSVTGLPPDHQQRLDCAVGIAESLLEAVEVLDETGAYCRSPGNCDRKNHYELKA